MSCDCNIDLGFDVRRVFKRIVWEVVCSCSSPSHGMLRSYRVRALQRSRCVTSLDRISSSGNSMRETSYTNKVVSNLNSKMDSKMASRMFKV